jgi:hypothetical protein
MPAQSAPIMPKEDERVWKSNLSDVLQHMHDIVMNLDKHGSEPETPPVLIFSKPSASPAPQRYSMRTLRPSAQPLLSQRSETPMRPRRTQANICACAKVILR